MPHVSRHVPVRKVSDDIFNLFMECVTAKWSTRERRAFFDDLLTPTERIMFSKRLAILYLLAKGYTVRSIQEMLRVSPSTVARLWTSVQRGKYAEVMRRIQKKSERDPDIVRWFATLMPPRHMTRKQHAERMRRLNL